MPASVFGFNVSLDLRQQSRDRAWREERMAMRAGDPLEYPTLLFQKKDDLADLHRHGGTVARRADSSAAPNSRYHSRRRRRLVGSVLATLSWRWCRSGRQIPARRISGRGVLGMHRAQGADGLNRMTTVG